MINDFGKCITYFFQLEFNNEGEVGEDMSLLK